MGDDCRWDFSCLGRCLLSIHFYQNRRQKYWPKIPFVATITNVRSLTNAGRFNNSPTDLTPSCWDSSAWINCVVRTEPRTTATCETKSVMLHNDGKTQNCVIKCIDKWDWVLTPACCVCVLRIPFVGTNQNHVCIFGILEGPTRGCNALLFACPGSSVNNNPLAPYALDSVHTIWWPCSYIEYAIEISICQIIFSVPRI